MHIHHHHKQNEIQSTTKAAATIPTSETTTATTTFNDAYNNNNSNNTNASDELDFDSTVEIIPFTISDINNITATPTTTIFNEDTIPLHVTTFNNNQGINDDSYIHSTTTFAFDNKEEKESNSELIQTSQWYENCITEITKYYQEKRKYITNSIQIMIQSTDNYDEAISLIVSLKELDNDFKNLKKKHYMTIIQQL